MKAWFDEQRLTMINSACEKVLSPQIQGPLSFSDVIQIAAYIERSNTPPTTKNSMVDLSKHNIDILSELAQAIVAEAVATFDDNTITTFIYGSDVEDVLDFTTVDEDVTPSYIGDKLAKLPERIEAHIKSFAEGDSFVLASPLIISVMQSAGKSKFASSNESAFRGPNNTLMVGNICSMGSDKKTPVYSYIPNLYQRNDDEDIIIIGNYISGRDAATTRKLTVRNLSFA